VTYYRVTVTLHGGPHDGAYSLYENVGAGAGKPYQFVEDAAKGMVGAGGGNGEMAQNQLRAYADTLIRLPTPDPHDIDADGGDVRSYYTETGFETRIGSEATLQSAFDTVAGRRMGAPFRRAAVHVETTTAPGEVVYRDPEQIAAV
jgi:hypothetical protein